ncbi:peptide chain release factor N(5)-glutamine methyltransferase [Thermanaeromonas sp. C210]|uniref:peptide chain release factor N(5)-glutamine methyltransferase n=1 Tax=Thermanaeromonas sp. C210 TaxID=2731925 RepID=UPI0015633A9A|nr:peptide chain release factor N(5)-glutamine methyltransferase [Thermanaeromonas sp. C210]
MTLGEALEKATSRLRRAGVEEPRLEAEVLLAAVSGLTRPQLLARREYLLAGETVEEYLRLVARRSEGYPLQYLTGCREFMGLPFKVTPDVLIPRGDTEVLVEAVLNRADRDRPWVVADVGTGSGAIAVSLAYYLPRAFIYALDISKGALRVAAENARRLGVAERIRWEEGDLLEPLLKQREVAGAGVDAVVANLPYIPAGEWEKLPREVRHEPRLALDGGPDGLDLYRRLLPQAAALLKPGGLLAVEIGPGQGPAMAQLAAALGAYTAGEIIKDYAGRPRCFLARRAGHGGQALFKGGD